MRRSVALAVAVIMPVALWLTACSPHRSHSSAVGSGRSPGSTHADARVGESTLEDTSHPPPHPEIPVGKYGIACLTYQQRTTPSNLSYSVADIGKEGVPTLTDSQVTMIRRIQKYVHSETLRFGFTGRGQFIVFDADAGPCFDGAPGYWVMNDPDINSFYEPGEAPDFIHAIPGEVAPTPGPWMRP